MTNLAVTLYSWSTTARFESRLGHRPTSVRFLVVFLGVSRPKPGQYLSKVKIVSCQILSKPSLIYHHTGMLPSSEIQRRVIRMRKDVSEERITSIFRIKQQQSKKPEYSRWLGRILFLARLIFDHKFEGETSVHIRTTRRYIPEDGNIHNSRCENLISYISCNSNLYFKPWVGSMFQPNNKLACGIMT
jgi:hypothetical protein